MYLQGEEWHPYPRHVHANVDDNAGTFLVSGAYDTRGRAAAAIEVSFPLDEHRSAGSASVANAGLLWCFYAAPCVFPSLGHHRDVVSDDAVRPGEPGYFI